MPQREALSTARVVDAAVRVADRGGFSAVSMRNVAEELSVKAMSLYHHVEGKERLLDELADWVFGEIDLSVLDGPWREAMRHRAASARRVLAQHPWAVGLIESRKEPGPHLLRHHDAVLGCLRRDGFSVGLAAHAFSAIDAYVYGFVVTELNLPFEPAVGAEDFVSTMEFPADAYPFLTEMIETLVVGGGYAFSNEFDYGLDLILDGLERRHAEPGAAGR